MAKVLTRDQGRIAAAFGMSPAEFSSAKAAQESRQAGRSRWGLSASQQAICRAMNVSEHSFASAAGEGDRRTASPGLLRAHQEIDRAHDELYSEGQAVDPPDRELLDNAMAELKSYDPDDDDTYDHLLKGVLHAATLLNRVAPPFAENKDID